MRRKIWYYAVRAQLQLGFILFFRKFTVKGKEHISGTRPTLFLPNHQNTFLDALTLAVSTRRMTHYMARADIFTNPKLIWLMSTINLRPIYRIRDGKKAVAKNQQVFSELQSFLNDGECVMIHPEGTHSLKYRLKSLHSGFTRLAFGFLEKYPDQQLDIIPVGINYSNHTDFRSSASIHYGQPTDARHYFEMEDRNFAIQQLRDKMEKEIRQLVVHIEPEDEYEEKVEQLRAAGADFSEMEATREKLQKIQGGEELPPARVKRPNLLERLLYPLVYLNNIVFVLLWKKLKPVFKDPAWHGSMKFVLGTFLGPGVYFVQTLVIYLFLGPVWAFLYIFFSLVTLPILRIGQEHTHH